MELYNYHCISMIIYWDPIMIIYTMYDNDDIYCTKFLLHIYILCVNQMVYTNETVSRCVSGSRWSYYQYLCFQYLLASGNRLCRASHDSRHCLNYLHILLDNSDILYDNLHFKSEVIKYTTKICAYIFVIYAIYSFS